jgi:beta-galactosidase
MWHVSNEYGGEDFSDQSRAAFIEWLKVRYDHDLGRLNQAYWSAFWGHTYTDWDEIEIPGQPYGESSIHGLNLDWKRFSSDRIIEFFRHESAPLREITPEIPITTNLMGLYPVIDCAKIAPYVDVMTWDSYPAFNGRPSEPEMWVNIAFIHDLNRSFKQKPFLLIESTPSSSNWYPVMQLKRPGTHELEAMQAIAHGSEGVMYFQWRQSRGSQEKFHGAVVGHGTENRSRVFKEVARVGQELPKLNELVGISDPSEVAVIYDWENRWAVDDAVGPILKGKNYAQTCTDHYRAFWELGVPVDVIDSTRDLSSYKVVVAPMLYMLKPGVAESLSAFVANGGTLVSTYYTGYVNESDLVFEDGYLAPLRHLFGIEVEEIDAFYPDEAFAINGFDRKFHGHTLCEIVHPRGAEVLATVSEVFYAGSPALTRNVFGRGQAYYVAGRADENFTHTLIERIVNELNIKKTIETPLPKGVTAQRRGNRVFIMNCTPHPQDVGGLELPPYGVSIR